MTRIVVLDDYQGIAIPLGDWDRLGPDCDVTTVRQHVTDTDELASLLKGAEVLVVMRERTRITRALFERLPDLRLVVTMGMRNVAIDLAAAADHGVLVSGTDGGAGRVGSGPVGNPTVEHTWALILGLARNLPRDDAAIRAGRWQELVGTHLGGTRLGLLGLGRIGRQVAAIGRAFEMEPVAWSPHLDEARAREGGARLVARDELFATADVLTIHLVLGEGTRGLVGAAELALMKPTALLVNTSRGPIVDETALIDTLRRGAIGGAALDVFDEEPLPVDHPLRSLPNTVLTPHVAFVTTPAMADGFRQMIASIDAYRQGRPIRLLA